MMRRILTNRLAVFAALGFAVFVLSRRWLTYSLALHTDESFLLLMHLAFDAGVVLSALFCVLLVRRKGLLYTRASLLAFALCYALMPLVLLLSSVGIDLGSPASFIGAVIFGIGYSGTICLWVEVFSKLDAVKITVSWLAANLLASLLENALAGAGSLVFDGVALILPLIGAALMVLAHASIDAPILTTEARTVVPSSFSMVYYWAAYYLFVYTLSYASIGNGGSVLLSLLHMALLAGVLVFVIGRDRKRLNYPLAFRLSFFLLALGLVLGLLAGSFSNVSQLFVRVAYLVMCLLVILLSTSTAQKFNISPVSLYGVIILAFVGGAALGKVVSFILAEDLLPVNIEATIVAVAILLLIIIPSALFRETGFVKQWSLIDSLHSNNADEALVVAACNAVAKKNRLSARETNVLTLLALEIPQSQIAQDLFIAPGTVRAHIGHIYSKLSVQSREELHTLVHEQVLKDMLLQKK